jgi:2-polyprenyl-3-methyl-5-hydroxy-6-metoxy-1,4-benzoquinol methylase
MKDERVIPGETNVINLQKHIARYNLALQFSQGKEVLDIACGTGYGSNLLSLVAERVTGIDRCKWAIDFAKENYQNKKINFQTKDFYKQFGQYDTVVCFETVEHLRSIKKTENKVLEWLKPGSFFVFSVPLNEEPDYNAYHFHQFDLKGAKTLFSKISTIGELIQTGSNFTSIDDYQNQRFSYYIAVKQLN